MNSDKDNIERIKYHLKNVGFFSKPEKDLQLAKSVRRKPRISARDASEDRGK